MGLHGSLHAMSTVRAAAPPSAAASPHVIRTRAVVSWVLYDLANTIFSMGVVSLYFPILVRGHAGADEPTSCGASSARSRWGSSSSRLPLLGAMTDRAAKRMPFLVVSTIICVVFHGAPRPRRVLRQAVCFIIANVAYQAGLQFYDAMLPEVSHEGNRGKISGIGVGVGYLGSYIAVGLGLKSVFGTTDKAFLFTMIAVFFLLFALPCFLFVKERGNPHPREVFSLRMLRESTRDTLRTMRSSQRVSRTAALPGGPCLLHRCHQHRDHASWCCTRSTSRSKRG